MDTLKKILYSPTTWWLVLLFIFGALLWSLVFQQTYLAIPYNDSMDYASMANNIYQGRGIVSNYLTPLSLTQVGEPFPNIWRAPLWPILLAVSYYFAGASDVTVALASGFFYLLTIAPLFLLARKIFDRWVAAAVVLIYIGSPLLLHFSTSGMTESLATFFLVTWFWLLYDSGTRKPLYFILPGVVAGLFYLARYNALLFLPLTMVYIGWLLWGENRSRRQIVISLSIYVGSCLLVMSPWLVRNYIVAGSPLFSLQSFEPAMFTEEYPGYTLYMMPWTVNVREFVFNNWALMMDKVQGGREHFTSYFFESSFSGLPGWLMVMGLLGIALPGGRKYYSFKALVVLCYLLQLVSLWFVHYIPRLFVMFIPFYILFAVGFVWWVINCVVVKRFWSKVNRRWLEPLLLAVLVGVSFWTNPVEWQQNNSRYDWQWTFKDQIVEASDYFEYGDVIVSNDGHLFSWYSDLITVKIPYHPEQLADLQEMAPVKGILLTWRLGSGYRNTPEAHPEWERIMEERPQVVGNFRLARTYYYDGSLLYVLNEEVED